MVDLWVYVLVAVIAGAAGAVLTLSVVSGRRRKSPVEVATSVATALPTPSPPASHETPVDQWLVPARRCEQAVYRAGRAVDTVSSHQARRGLRSVVRRMDAELPSVRALMELGRSLDADPSRDEQALDRVHSQLVDASTRFAMVTDHVLETVVELVAAGDFSRSHQQVVVLREQFPLLRPLSAVLGPEAGTAPKRSLLDLPG